MKTVEDFTLAFPEWLIDDWLPLGHRIIDVAHAGSYKTTLGTFLGCSIAAGKPVFGREVCQGPVMFIDEETPESSLDDHINRFCAGLGTTFKKLPIFRTVKVGFKFGKKNKARTDIFDAIKKTKPVFIRMDSFAAMIPEGMKETDGNVGKVIQNDLNEMLELTDNKCSIMLSVHTKKYFADLPFTVVKDSELETIVRGHGSIVAEGCDTGLILYKISENPDPSRFAIINRARRAAIPATSKIMYVEIKEEQYGKGWARMELMSKIVIPPSEFAIALYPILAEVSQGGGHVQKTTEQIHKTANLIGIAQTRMGLQDLLDNKVILHGVRPMTLMLNPKESEVEPEYLNMLKRERKL